MTARQDALQPLIEAARRRSPRRRREKFVYDHSGNVLSRIVTENVDPELDSAREVRNNTDNGFTKERTMRHIGRVPLGLIDQWASQGIRPQDLRDAKLVRRLLNIHNKCRTVDGML
jgi:hypothetical protein